jgi:K+-sensing histidine kinase KdpD
MPAAALRRCLVALTNNAVTHTRDGGIVDIRTETNATTATILVRDQGTGLHGIRPDQLFQRFAHGTREREPRIGAVPGQGHRHPVRRRRLPRSILTGGQYLPPADSTDP